MPTIIKFTGVLFFLLSIFLCISTYTPNQPYNADIYHISENIAFIPRHT